AFDDFQGEFYSGDNTPEVIILTDFGRLLLNLPPEPANSDAKLSPDQIKQLLGKNLVFRYAQRSTEAPAPAPAPAAAAPSGDSAGSDASAFNIVRKEQNLRIVGVVNSEPYRGLRQGRTSVLLPNAFAESLNMIQPGDVRSLIRPAQGK